MNIVVWLQNLGLDEHAQSFIDNGVDDSLLRELTNDDLKDLGITRLVDRKRVLNAIAAILKNEDEAVASLESVTSTINVTSELVVDRRQVTVMFIDLIGSTTLSQNLDPEDLREVIRQYQDSVAGAVIRYEGYVAKFLGDGVLAYFGWPKAYEDQGERAVLAGLDATVAVKELKQGGGITLQSRVGIATGQVVIGDIINKTVTELDAVFGETPNLAARLEALASPNTVVIDVKTQRLLSNRFSYKNLGKQHLKGFVDPVQAWEVVESHAVESRFGATHTDQLARIVGRDQEVNLLCERWKLATTGEGQVVLLSGEAGIGKSRIAETLKDKLKDENHLRIRYQCSPHHLNSSLYPAIQQLVFSADINADDSPDKKLDKLEALLEKSSAVDSTPLIATLLSIPTGDRYKPVSMTAQEQKHATLHALIGLFEGLAANRPLLFILEDVHWMDPTTGEQMDLLIERVRTLPALVLITFRPEFEAPWRGYAHCTALALNRLGRSACNLLISDLTSGRVLPASVYEQIVAKTDGVPLFVEELTKNILESDILELVGNKYVLSGPLPPLAIPSTLQDALTARLDRLESVKEIAQIGAAIGREFSFNLLEMVSSLKGKALEDALDRLCKAEIVFRRGLPLNTIYIFKHALIQDTAYDTLLRSRRQQIHATIAKTLQAHFALQVEPAILAHHYTQAGLLKDALPYWLLAGQHSISRSANPEAIAHLTKGLDVISRLPKISDSNNIELDLQICLGTARIATRGYSAVETENAWLRARKLLGDVVEGPRQLAVLHGLCMVYWNRAQLARMEEVNQDLLQRALRQKEILPQLVAHRLMSVGLNSMGKFEESRQHAEVATELYNPELHKSTAHRFGHDMGVGAYWHLAISLLFLGHPDASTKAAVQASELTKSLKNINTNFYNSLWSSYTCLVRRDWEAAREIASDMVEQAGDLSLALWVAFGRHLLGCSLVGQGDHESGLNELRKSRREADNLNNSIFKPMSLQFEAQALSSTGNHTDAINCLDTALRIVSETHERWWEPEILRIQANINYAMDSDSEEIETQLKHAMNIASQQSSRLMELRCAVDLATYWQSQDNSCKIRTMLTPKYDWFCEGHHLPDLQNAKSFLEERS